MNNNIFKYATSELSQDAVICWCVNWINYPNGELHLLGKAMLDLFLGDNKFDEYSNIAVNKQYKNIDVLVFFKSQGEDYALIIEDKVHTSEHSNQIERYKKFLKIEKPELNKVFVAYVKTGIMYDADWLIGECKELITVINLKSLLDVLTSFVIKKADEDELYILQSYVAYLSEISKKREDIEINMYKQLSEELFDDAYGQFCFLDKIFDQRTKGKKKIEEKNMV